jgi:hypothetical protein
MAAVVSKVFNLRLSFVLGLSFCLSLSATEFSKRLARIIERPHGVRLLVALPLVRDLLFRAKHLFFAARRHSASKRSRRVQTLVEGNQRLNTARNQSRYSPLCVLHTVLARQVTHWSHHALHVHVWPWLVKGRHHC